MHLDVRMITEEEATLQCEEDRVVWENTVEVVYIDKVWKVHHQKNQVDKILFYCFFVSVEKS